MLPAHMLQQLCRQSDVHMQRRRYFLINWREREKIYIIYNNKCWIWWQLHENIVMLLCQLVLLVMSVLNLVQASLIMETATNQGNTTNITQEFQQEVVNLEYMYLCASGLSVSAWCYLGWLASLLLYICCFNGDLLFQV